MHWLDRSRAQIRIQYSSSGVSARRFYIASKYRNLSKQLAHKAGWVNLERRQQQIGNIMTDMKRRKFNKMLGGSVVGIPLATLIGQLPSHAADTVDPDSAQAKALQYMAESDKDGKACKSCSLYQGDASSDSGPCPLFPGVSVHANGWCSAYVPKA